VGAGYDDLYMGVGERICFVCCVADMGVEEVRGLANKPLHPCNQPGCPELIRDGPYCEKHKRDRQRAQDQRRGSAASRGYDGRWRQYRETFLREHPLCVECLKSDKVVAASVVDHIKPHKGDKRLFWDMKNHQPLCKRCHDVKTAKFDSGFGNIKK